jgi:hypothetical protein
MKIFSYIWKVEERSCGISYYVIVKNGITYEETGNEEKMEETWLGTKKG